MGKHAHVHGIRAGVGARGRGVAAAAGAAVAGHAAVEYAAAVGAITVGIGRGGALAGGGAGRVSRSGGAAQGAGAARARTTVDPAAAGVVENRSKIIVAIGVSGGIDIFIAGQIDRGSRRAGVAAVGVLSGASITSICVRGSGQAGKIIFRQRQAACGIATRVTLAPVIVAAFTPLCAYLRCQSCAIAAGR